jgi:hypothetical protein
MVLLVVPRRDEDAAARVEDGAEAAGRARVQQDEPLRVRDAKDGGGGAVGPHEPQRGEEGAEELRRGVGPPGAEGVVGAGRGGAVVHGVREAQARAQPAGVRRPVHRALQPVHDDDEGGEAAPLHPRRPRHVHRGGERARRQAAQRGAGKRQAGGGEQRARPPHGGGDGEEEEADVPHPGRTSLSPATPRPRRGEKKI